jgi:hypothetical protein
MTERTKSLSSEARSLIERTYHWLQPKNRWTKHAYAVFHGDNEHVLELDDEYDLIGKNWKNWEEEHDEFYRYEKDEYEYSTPFVNVEEPTQACLIGSLIVNNDYHKDPVYDEAVNWLNGLVDETKLKADDEYRYAEVDPETRLIYFNDKSPDRRRVMSLLRRGFRKS